MRTDFRVWNLKDGWWFDPKEFNLLGDPLFVQGFYDAWDIQQWTGLLDKNETKIYEGDFVTFEYGVWWTGEPQKALGQVVFENGAYYFKTETKTIFVGHSHKDSVVVVGNIHER